jgi:hypothetical protein
VHSVEALPHMKVHAPPEQTSSRPQARPHSPQWRESVCTRAQVSPASPLLQSRSSAAQLGTHAAFWQTSPVAHRRPQAPQLVSSACVLTQRSRQ